MIHTLENDYVKITASNEGGEIYSITNKRSNRDILWNGRSFGWNMSAPTLFPIIGNVRNGKIKVDNKKYTLKQHGFANRYTHDLVSKNDNEIKFELKYSKDTLKSYPFKFSIETTYSIFENEISITFNVKNIDDKDIYFSLGSHPCFFCPFNKEDDLNEYYLEFQCIEDASIFEINKHDLLTGNKINYLKNTNIIRLNNKTFSNGTLIFDNLKSKSVSLKSNIRDEEIKVELGDFKYLALWALEETRPFICIEPWFGHADYDKFNGEFKEKEGIVKLDRGKEHTMSYKIIVK